MSIFLVSRLVMIPSHSMAWWLTSMPRSLAIQSMTSTSKPLGWPVLSMKANGGKLASMPLTSLPAAWAWAAIRSSPLTRKSSRERFMFSPWV